MVIESVHEWPIAWVEIVQVGMLTSSKSQSIWKNSVNGSIRVYNRDYGESYYAERFVIGYKFQK